MSDITQYLLKFAIYHFFNELFYLIFSKLYKITYLIIIIITIIIRKWRDIDSLRKEAKES